jgi:hypothetical protein
VQKKTYMKTRILLGLFILGSCRGQHYNVDKDIAELSYKLPKIETPIIFNSNNELKFKAIELGDNGILIKLRDKNHFSVIGKLFETENYIAIIGYIPDDVGTPILEVFDKKGNEIDFHPIYETVMGDMGHYTSNYVTIFPDRQIQFIDSTITRKINKDGTDEIPGTDSLSVTIKRYKITDKGTIENLD